MKTKQKIIKLLLLHESLSIHKIPEITELSVQYIHRVINDLLVKVQVETLGNICSMIWKVKKQRFILPIIDFIFLPNFKEI